MCPGPDAGMLILMLLFLVCVAASPLVILAAIVHSCRKRRAETPLRILD